MGAGTRIPVFSGKPSKGRGRSRAWSGSLKKEPPGRWWLAGSCVYCWALASWGRPASGGVA